MAHLSRSILLRSGWLASLAFLGPQTANSQSPGAAIPDAIRSVIGQWCWSELRIQDVKVPQFPGVRFKRGTCTGEHGDELSALVAIDSDSVLYLLTSSDALNFLLARHPVSVPKDTAGLLAHARLILDLAGQADPRASTVTAWENFPAAARDSARGYSVRPVQVVRQGPWWTVRLFTVEDGAFGPYANGYDVWFDPEGTRVDVKRAWHWQRVAGP